MSFNALFKMKSFNSAWEFWLPEILNATDNFKDPYKILQLGNHLSSIFISTSKPGRGQGIVSAAGASWEGLTCWYLNLVLSGTNALAIKQSKLLVPEAVNEALTVNYSNIQTNTESDIIVIVFPDDFDFDSILARDTAGFSMIARKRISEIEAHVVQCKTNWNDNAQIPMLWDMVYKADGFKSSNLTIGKNGISMSDLKDFSYSFVTVPSQKEERIPKAGSIAVNRVKNLSGGNYWGRPSQSGVARGLHEYFKHNLANVFDGPVDHSIAAAIKQNIGWFSHKEAGWR